VGAVLGAVVGTVIGNAAAKGPLPQPVKKAAKVSKLSKVKKGIEQRALKVVPRSAKNAAATVKRSGRKMNRKIVAAKGKFRSTARKSPSRPRPSKKSKRA
jgi:hypothetical protein